MRATEVGKGISKDKEAKEYQPYSETGEQFEAKYLQLSLLPELKK